MLSSAEQKTSAVGRVFLVGAGPGDAGLITLRGAACLGLADIVLYDYLVNPRILQHVRAGAETICLGDSPQGSARIWTQREINQRLVELAKAGKTVVRLKGGDPSIFARGAEEVEALQEGGIPFEIVPGVTAALAAAGYAGIPITHREHASAVALITGQERPGKEEPALDYASLAHFPGTLVFYMGATTSAFWSRQLIQAGMSAQTPVAIVRRCSFPDQRSVLCTLGEVAERLGPEGGLGPPVIVIVGPVAAWKPVQSWFESRPLFGLRILVTRPLDQAADLALPLESLGAEVLYQPAIAISPHPDLQALDAVLQRLAQFDWIVFSSTNGVRFFLQRLLQGTRDLRALASGRLAAVGPGTAAELNRFHLHADLQPSEFRAESLAAELVTQAAGKCFLLVRGSRGRDLLAQELLAAGGLVEQVIVYDSTDVTQPDLAIAQKLRDGQIDWVTVTSSAIARSLVNLFGTDLQRTRLASISPLTSATLREFGFEPAFEAAPYTMDSLASGLAASLRK